MVKIEKCEKRVCNLYNKKCNTNKSSKAGSGSWTDTRESTQGNGPK